MDKKNRILAILYRLLTGEHISQKDLVSEYGVEERSIRRDIAVLRQFLSENRERVGDLELLRKNEVYYLNHTDLLSPDELLLVIKILIGSRVMDETKQQKLLEGKTAWCVRRKGVPQGDGYWMWSRLFFHFAGSDGL